MKVSSRTAPLRSYMSFVHIGPNLTLQAGQHLLVNIVRDDPHRLHPTLNLEFKTSTHSAITLWRNFQYYTNVPCLQYCMSPLPRQFFWRLWSEIKQEGSDFIVMSLWWHSCIKEVRKEFNIFWSLLKSLKNRSQIGFINFLLRNLVSHLLLQGNVSVLCSRIQSLLL